MDETAPLSLPRTTSSSLYTSSKSVGFAKAVLWFGTSAISCQERNKPWLACQERNKPWLACPDCHLGLVPSTLLAAFALLDYRSVYSQSHIGGEEPTVSSTLIYLIIAIPVTRPKLSTTALVMAHKHSRQFSTLEEQQAATRQQALAIARVQRQRERLATASLSQLHQGETIIQLGTTEIPPTTLPQLGLRVQNLTLPLDSNNIQSQQQAVPVYEHQSLYTPAALEQIWQAAPPRLDTSNTTHHAESQPGLWQPLQPSNQQATDISHFFRPQPEQWRPPQPLYQQSTGINRFFRPQIHHETGGPSGSSRSPPIANSQPRPSPLTSSFSRTQRLLSLLPSQGSEDQLYNSSGDEDHLETPGLPESPGLTVNAQDGVDHDFTAEAPIFRPSPSLQGSLEGTGSLNLGDAPETSIVLLPPPPEPTRLNSTGPTPPCSLHSPNSPVSTNFNPLSEHASPAPTVQGVPGPNSEPELEDEVSQIAVKLCQLLLSEAHGCTPQEHETELQQHIIAHLNNHHGLDEISNDPGFPHVLQNPILLVSEHLPNISLPGPTQWHETFCGITAGSQSGQPLQVCLHQESTQEVEIDIA
jgi:hypothetical protein